MRRRAFSPLACALLIGLTGCGARAAGPATDRADETAVAAEPPSADAGVDQGSLTAAGRVALRYTLAAQSWTAATYQTQYRRQLALAAGPLRRALRQAAPPRAQLAAYRADDAEETANAVAVTRLFEVATQARYRVLVDERSATAAQTITQRAGYLVELQRHNGTWRVSAFTIQP